MSATGVKRARGVDWEDIDDPEQLKELLQEQDDEIAELKEEIKSLKQKVAKAAKKPGAPLQPVTPAAAAHVSEEALEKAVTKMRRAIQSNLGAQMVYKSGVKHGGGSRLTAEIPNLTETQLLGVLGPELCAKASRGPKQIKVTADGDALSTIGIHLSKSLRYGADLGLKGDLTFTFEKATGNLKVAGMYTMFK